MVVTPSSLSSLSENELALIARVEVDIDKELRLNFVQGKPVYVRNAILRKAYAENVRVINAIKSSYASAGWTITEYESEDGPWLSFAES